MINKFLGHLHADNIYNNDIESNSIGYEYIGRSLEDYERMTEDPKYHWR